MAAQSSCAPTSRSFSRADIVALGQAGKPWEFLAIAARALDLAPQDAGIRFLVAANLSRLGLPTLALMQLDTLPAEVRSDPAVTALELDLRAAPNDRVSPDSLRAIFEANFAVIRARGVACEIDPGPWLRTLDSWVVCRARGGSVVRCPAQGAALSSWVGLTDACAAAAKAAAELPAAKDGFASPVVLDGADPPWALLECVRARPVTANGYEPPIIVVEEDVGSFLWSLATADLREALGQERQTLFVGPGAVERFERSLMGRLESQVSGFCIPVRAGGNAGLRAAFHRACEAQQRLATTLQERARELYSGRDREYWRRRYESASAGGEPLRILIPTTRYSTFVKHASQDLAEAARRTGHQARVMLEADDRSRFSAAAYLREIVEFEPDLVVLVNYPRAAMRDVFPANLPFVCWLQDPMPHLFDAGVGAAQSGLDFLAGHLFAELFAKFGYPTERAVPAPVVASSEKFHTGPVAPPLREKHVCEIAFVTHHAQTPEELLGTLLAQAGPDVRVRRALEGILPAVRTAVSESCRVAPHQALAREVRSHLRAAFGEEPDDRTMTSVLRHYALPLAERMFRHEAVAWAYETCARRGWRLNLYGRGWEKHPRFGAFARGELEHGDDLRAAYASARVHLHVSLGTLVHQRVLECALSGGLPLCRLHRDAIAGFKARAQLACAALGEPHAVDDARGLVGWRVADCPEAMAMTAQVQRLGDAVSEATGHAGVSDEFCWVRRERLESMLRLAPAIDARHEPMWLLGDLSETTFWSAATLEDCVARAIERPEWRENVSKGIRSRVSAELTHDSFLSRLLGIIGASLSSPSGPASPATNTPQGAFTPVAS